jgi:hypothetical protein
MIERPLRDWIVDGASTARGWEADPPIGELHCHPDLVARLAEVARPLAGTARVFVAGCPVVHAAGGPPIAAASGRAWVAVASGRAAGSLASRAPHNSWLPTGWVELDPWAPDVAFARAIDLLRAHVVDALHRVGPH